MDRGMPEDPFADEPRKVGGQQPEAEEESGAEAAGEREAGAGDGPRRATPSQEIENPVEGGEAPSG
jgi:hypothetical protein